MSDGGTPSTARQRATNNDIMRDIGRLEGRLCAVEQRQRILDDHMARIDTKLDGISEALSARLGAVNAQQGFWTRIIAVVAVISSFVVGAWRWLFDAGVS